MQEKIFFISYKDSLVEKTAEFIFSRFKTLEKVCVVFPGKRPSLFLKRELARAEKKSFIPPVIFSIDEFVQYLLGKEQNFRKPYFLEEQYLLYEAVKEKGLSLGKDFVFRQEDLQNFSSFMPWAKEVMAFINHLDIEAVSSEKLQEVEKQAGIGFEAAEKVNRVLRNISLIRSIMHERMEEKQVFCRGYMYRKAAEAVRNISLPEFDAVIFAGFFYLNRCELAIIKHIFNKYNAFMFFQAGDDKWSLLSKALKELGAELPKIEVSLPDIKCWAGFDKHSQACLAKEALKEISSYSDTVIVVPDKDNLVPLVSEISSLVREFNVSLGYSLTRCSLWELFLNIMKAQENRNKGLYYVQDYLRVLLHPLAKNFKYFGREPLVSRIIAHKTEEMLLGMFESSLGGSLFVDISLIEKESILLEECTAVLARVAKAVPRKDVKAILETAHKMFFKRWENISSLRDLKETVLPLLDGLSESGHLCLFPLNGKLASFLYDFFEDIEKSSIFEYEFGRQEVFKIFRQALEPETVPFKGTPLKGLQVLGLFETRGLNFKNVVIVDANESVLPKLKAVDPLIPRQILVSLGINRLEMEEEIQRYHFLRLVKGAEKVFLIYIEGGENSRSRFVEYLIWQMEKRTRSIKSLEEKRARFKTVVFKSQPSFIEKTAAALDVLERLEFSPTSLDTYLYCPLRFYFRYVLGLKEKENISGEVDGGDVGVFIHKLLEDTFKKFLGKNINITNAFRNKFFEEFEKRFEESFTRRHKAEGFLLKEVMRDRLERFLSEEAETGTKIISLETVRQQSLNIAGRRVNFKYIIDRIDQYPDGSLLIIDYKTGSELKIPSREIFWQDISDRVFIKKKLQSFQLPLYYFFSLRNYGDKVSNACLYSLRSLEKKTLFPEKGRYSKEDALAGYMKCLEFIAAEIFDINAPFMQDREDEGRLCKTCPYFYMCRQ